MPSSTAVKGNDSSIDYFCLFLIIPSPNIFPFYVFITTYLMDGILCFKTTLYIFVNLVKTYDWDSSDKISDSKVRSNMTVTTCSILIMGVNETIKMCIYLCITQFFSKHFQTSWKSHLLKCIAWLKLTGGLIVKNEYICYQAKHFSLYETSKRETHNA